MRTSAQVPGGVVITVRRKGGKGEAMRLKGFKGGDLSGLKELCQANYSKTHLSPSTLAL